MFHQTPLKSLALLLIVSGLAAYAIFGGFFDREIVIEIAILAILVISLDFVAGYGGMISLCHGAIFGLGAYGYAVSTVIFGWPASLGVITALTISTIFGLVVGAITSKTTGIFFIMATLAFGQMAYVTIFEARSLGGDDGLAGVSRFDFSAIGIDLNDSLQYALFCLFVLVVAYFLLAKVLGSAFGRTLVGIHANEPRMRALGVPVWRYKAAAFGISSFVAGFGGILAAQHILFVSPELLVWTVSGEALIVVILGGLGTLVGPILGATLLVLLHHTASEYTDHWHMIIGVLLIIAVLIGARGVYGQIEDVVKKRGKARALDA